MPNEVNSQGHTSETWQWATRKWSDELDADVWVAVDPATFKSTGYPGNPQLILASRIGTPLDWTSDDEVVLSAGDGEYTPYRDAKSAALVAAAPELLAACERAMQEYMRRAWTDPANPGGPCADLRDAIEKARGGAR